MSNTIKIALILAGVFIISCNDPKAVDVIIQNHLEATGFDGDLSSKAYCIDGNLEIKRYGIDVPFSISTDGNSYYVFEQMDMPSAYPGDYLPSFSKLLFDEKAFLVTNFSLKSEYASSLGLDKDFDEDKIVFWEQFPKPVYDNWKSTETTIANPVMLLQQKGYSFKLDGKSQFNSQEVYVVTAFSPNSAIALKLFINTKNSLLAGMVFNSYHPQMGEVELTRKVNAYSNTGSYRYIKDWTDDRGGTEVYYHIKRFEVVDEPTHIAQIQKATQVFPLSSDRVEEVVEKYIVELKRYCPDSMSVAKIEHGLQLKLLNGEFNEELSPGILANKLNREILNLTGSEQHRIYYDPLEYMLLKENKELQHPTSFQLQSEKIENYSYLKLDKIPHLPNVKKSLDSIMLASVQEEAFVIDLRDNGGGDAKFNSYLMSYFFESNTLLYNKRTKDSSETVKTQNRGTKPKPNHNVFVVVNDETAGEAEQLAYMIQSFQIGTIIGRTTYGVTHSPKRIIIGDGIIAEIPFSEEIHARTGTNWEGQGVVPDLIHSVRNKEEIVNLIDSLQS